MSRRIVSFLFTTLIALSVPQLVEAQGNPRVTGEFSMALEGNDFYRLEEILIEAVQHRDGRVTGTVVQIQTFEFGGVVFPTFVYVGEVVELTFMENRAFVHAVSDDGEHRFYGLADHGEGSKEPDDAAVIFTWVGPTPPPPLSLSVLTPILDFIITVQRPFTWLSGNIQVRD